MSQWQPIETAPPMTHVLLWFPEGGAVIALVGRAHIDTARIGYVGRDMPTHWMPLPEGPQA